ALPICLFRAGARFGVADHAVTYHQCGAARRDPDATRIAPRGDAPPETSVFDAGLSAEQCAAFFSRHPYLDVLLMYLWFAHQSRPGPVPPPFDRLRTLADCDPERDSAGQAWQRAMRMLPVDCRYSASEIVRYYGEVYGVA